MIFRYICMSISIYPLRCRSAQRGIRFINGRQQILLQDDVTATSGIEWRMHTNATVVLNGASAKLSLGDHTMDVTILNPPAGAVFGMTLPAVRLETDPPLPPGQVDQPNPGVTVLTIDLPAGTYNLQVLFNPNWPGSSASSFVSPAMVPVNNWSLTSHG